MLPAGVLLGVAATFRGSGRPGAFPHPVCASSQKELAQPDCMYAFCPMVPEASVSSYQEPDGPAPVL